MIELSMEKVEKILYQETPKTDALPTILRSIYTRYMRLYERYFADIDSLDDEVIAEFRKFNDETASFVKYYYMDIPMDIFLSMEEFEEKYSAHLLGPGWHDYLFNAYEDFREDYYDYDDDDESEETLKAAFAKEALKEFYDRMDNIFREGFNTGSETGKSTVDALTGILFEQEQS